MWARDFESERMLAGFVHTDKHRPVERARSWPDGPQTQVIHIPQHFGTVKKVSELAAAAGHLRDRLSKVNLSYEFVDLSVFGDVGFVIQM